MKPSYKRAIQFIAHNDEPAEDDPKVIESLLSVITLAIAFDVTEDKVARDILRARQKDAE